jgi:hypothetical protein
MISQACAWNLPTTTLPTETLDRIDGKLNLIAEHRRQRAENGAFTLAADIRIYELAETGREIRRALRESIADSRKRHAETTAKFNALLELERQPS